MARRWFEVADLYGDPVSVDVTDSGQVSLVVRNVAEECDAEALLRFEDAHALSVALRSASQYAGRVSPV